MFPKIPEQLTPEHHASSLTVGPLKSPDQLFAEMLIARDTKPKKPIYILTTLGNFFVKENYRPEAEDFMLCCDPSSRCSFH